LERVVNEPPAYSGAPKTGNTFNFPTNTEPCSCQEDSYNPLTFCADHLGSQNLVCLVSLLGLSKEECSDDTVIPCILVDSCRQYRHQLVFHADEAYRFCENDSFIHPGAGYHDNLAAKYVGGGGGVYAGKGDMFRAFRNRLIPVEPDKYMGKWFDKKLRTDYYTEEFLPSGVQDVGAGHLGNFIVYTGGFCGGALCCGYYCLPRGHLYLSYALDVSSTESVSKGWRRIPRFPAANNHGRQGQGCATSLTTPSILVCVGGFAYAPARTMAGTKKPKEKVQTFADVYALHHVNSIEDTEDLAFAPGKWWWEQLSDYPFAVAYPSVVAWGPYIIVVGGCSATDNGLDCFFASSEVTMIGCRIYRLDVSRAGSIWEQLPPIPGTPRSYASVSVIKNQMYIFFGVLGTSHLGDSKQRYFNVADNWVMDLKSLNIARLPRYPLSAGTVPMNSIAFGRYILMFAVWHHPLSIYESDSNCSYHQEHIVAPTYTSSGELEFGKSVLVYDVIDKTFTYTDPLPGGLNYPAVIKRPGTENEFYLLGGEADVWDCLGIPVGRHSGLALRAVVSVP
jgi:hypothetical protein